MDKKTIFIICAVLIGVLLIYILPLNVQGIICSAIDTENGDIAIAFYSKHHSASAVRVQVFDINGNKLYTQTYLTGKPVELLFKNGALNVMLYYERQIFSYDRTGNEIQTNVLLKDFEDLSHFEFWEYSFLSNEYRRQVNGIEYRYEKPGIFKRKARVTIINSEKEIVIYETS